MKTAIPTRTFIALHKLALQLPENIGLLTHEGVPAFPTGTYWLIYLQRKGNGNRPPLRNAAGKAEGIVDIGHGWKLGITRIADEDMSLTDAVVAKVKQCAKELEAHSLIHTDMN